MCLKGLLKASDAHQEATRVSVKGSGASPGLAAVRSCLAIAVPLQLPPGLRWQQQIGAGVGLLARPSEAAQPAAQGSFRGHCSAAS